MMAENRQQLKAQKEQIEEMEKEKKVLEKRHAVRVNQLVHETMLAR